MKKTFGVSPTENHKAQLIGNSKRKENVFFLATE
jgi:hypothetical protein